MRLIDADALKEAMYYEAFETDSDMQRWDGGCWIQYEMFENAINSAPTIDTVKHGKWQATDDGWDGIYYVCSECGCPWTLIDGTPYDNGMNYCPNCGKKMDDNCDPTDFCSYAERNEDG